MEKAHLQFVHHPFYLLFIWNWSTQNLANDIPVLLFKVRKVLNERRLSRIVNNSNSDSRKPYPSGMLLVALEHIDHKLR